jgi:transcriptional regulator with XRE-family HTH domain
MKKKTHNNGIKKIRERFGLTQVQLATYLDVSNSMIGMAETGKRILPVQALLKLNTLDAHLQAPIHKTVQIHVNKQLQVHAPVLLKQIMAKSKELSYQIALLEKQLANAESKHQQALQIISFVETMQIKNHTEKIDAKDVAWLQVLQIQAQKNLLKHHPLKKSALQNKMAAMQNEQKGLHTLLTQKP